MGSQRKWRSDDRDLECADPPRPVGRPGARARVGESGHLRKHRDQLFVVRCEYAWHRTSFLWLHGCSFQMADVVRRDAVAPDRRRSVAFSMLAKFCVRETRFGPHLEMDSHWLERARND